MSFHLQPLSRALLVNVEPGGNNLSDGDVSVIIINYIRKTPFPISAHSAFAILQHLQVVQNLQLLQTH